jgi:signal transduction histidine kinase
MIYESSQNTYKLLENLLVWVLSQSGTIEYHPKVINIKSRIDENLNLLQPVAARKNIHLRSIISENIEISTDPDLIDIVIRNLVTNAIKFSLENQEVSVSVIRIPGNEGNDSVEIAVSDKGIGISPGNMKKLFQMDNNYSTQGTGGESGTGLGLLLCKEFVEKCGGTIWVESEPGKGSTFHFSIPNNKTPDGNIHV